ncbi:hypothetical protein [Parabacteroides sp.]
MNRILFYIGALVLLLTVNSCIKEDLEECPPQFTVKVFIEDKQYINIGEIPQLNSRDETLPFRDFVGTIHYSLHNLLTGEIADSSSFVPVVDDAKFYMIAFHNIPDGRYELTVWGNVTQDMDPRILHADGAEQTDLFMATSTLDFTSGFQTTDVLMKRVKGNLVLICNNFPSDFTHVEEKISSVYQSVDPHFVYSGSTNVVKTAPLLPVNQFLLAPTVNGTNSTVNLRFFNPNSAGNKSAIEFPEFNVTLSRNKISVISVDYNPETISWKIRTSLF